MAQTYDFNVEQGTDSSVLFVLKDMSGELLNLEGFTARMQIRRSKCGHALIDSLTTENGRMTIDVNKAQVEVKFTNETTSKYPPTTLVYDIELISVSGYVSRFLEGLVIVNAEVTRNGCGKC